jgi:hypothetical protein
MAARRDERREAVRGGVIGGVVGATALYVLLLIVTATAEQSLWTVFKNASAPFFGMRAGQPGFDFWPVVIGVVCHYLISIAWGVAFGLLAFGLRRGPTVAAGVLWGVVVWLGMYYVVLPLVGLAEAAANTPVSMAIFVHVLFGFFMAVGFLPYQRPRPPERPMVQRPTRGGRDLERQPDRSAPL